MIEIVKLTMQQAEAIEWVIHRQGRDYSHTELIIEHAKDITAWSGRASGLNRMPLLTLVDALRIGYEVEPQFKVGDWVACEYEDGTWIAQIEKFEGEKVFARWEFDRLDWNYIYDIRHATPEEIKAEQERRLWAGIGREVGNIQDGDTVEMRNIAPLLVTGTRDSMDNGFLTSMTAEKLYSEGKLKGFYPAESFIEFGGGER